MQSDSADIWAAVHAAMQTVTLLSSVKAMRSYRLVAEDQVVPPWTCAMLVRSRVSERASHATVNMVTMSACQAVPLTDDNWRPTWIEWGIT